MVPVLFVDNEIEAELARGRLESEGITAQVRFSARAGYPRYVAGYGGYGVGAPLSTYEVLVAERDAAAARQVLRSRPERGERRWWSWRRNVLMVIVLVYLVPLAFALVLQAVNALRLLF